MFDFIAIDFETANRRQEPCAVAAHMVKNGEIVEILNALIKPKGKFDDMCVRVHGITAADVKDAPAFPEIYEVLQPLLRHYPMVAHGAGTDRAIFVKACERYGLPVPTLTVYDTVSLYHKNYPALPHTTLDYLCRECSIELDHHKADSDSIACAKLFLRLLEDESTAIHPLAPLDEYNHYWPGDRDMEPESITFSFPTVKPQESQLVQPAVAYCNEFEIEDMRFVITGDIEDASRDTITELVKEHGGKVAGRVSGKTDYLAIGPLDPSVVSDKETYKSKKIIEAEAMQAAGGKIKFIRLQDLFDTLMELESAR